MSNPDRNLNQPAAETDKHGHSSEHSAASGGTASQTSVPPPPPENDPDAMQRYWYEHVYQGDTMRQLSTRSLVTGMMLGGIMSISNLYVGLKVGWGLTVTITSSILAFALFQVLQRIVPKWRNDHFTLLENYTMSSAAAAAGYTSSSGLVSAIPALYIVQPDRPMMAWWELMLWLLAVSILGLFIAIPVKRQLINIEQLPFPEGMATAQTLKSIHGMEGAGALARAGLLLAFAVFGGFVNFMGDGLRLLAGWTAAGKDQPESALSKTLSSWAIPEELPLLPTKFAHEWLTRYSIGLPGSLVLFAGGAIMGFRSGLWILVGSIFFYGIIGEQLITHGITGEGTGSKGITKWVLWPSTALLVTSSLTMLAFRWRTILRTLGGLGSLAFGKSNKAGVVDPLEELEVPGSWFVWGTLASGAACVILGNILFGIRYEMGILAVLMTMVLSLVAARATGETSVNPIGAMGKITQLTYGVLVPQKPDVNLMTAMITSGAANHAGDLLNDLKVGYVLGGNPRKQFVSQFVGVLSGAVICVPVYLLIAHPDAIRANPTRFPVPAAHIWASVAELLVNGPGGLPQYALLAMVIGGVLGVLLAIAEEVCPKKFKLFIPSSTALGIAGVLPAWDCVAMFVGAAIAAIVVRVRPSSEDEHVLPAAAGILAGESLTGVGVALAEVLPGAMLRS